MAHNTTLNLGSGGDTMVTVDLALATYPSGSNKVPASCLYVSATSTTAPTPCLPTNPLAVRLCDGSGFDTSMTVDNAGTFAVQATLAAGAATIAKAEDAASADADVGVPAMAVRKATPANTSGLDGDYEMLQMSGGRLWTSATIDAALPTGSATIGAVNLAQYTPSSGRLPVELDAAALAALETITVASITAALPAGTNNIGDVDVLTVPSDPFGANADAASATGSISAKLRHLAATGIAGATSLPAGTNNIGDVDVLTQVGAASLANAQVTVDTTVGGVQVAAARATRRAITIVNHGTTDVYVGAGTVSSSNGLLLVGTKGAALTLLTRAEVKAIVGSGTQVVSVIEEYD